jgi:hypothetical protein
MNGPRHEASAKTPPGYSVGMTCSKLNLGACSHSSAASMLLSEPGDHPMPRLYVAAWIALLLTTAGATVGARPGGAYGASAPSASSHQAADSAGGEGGLDARAEGDSRTGWGPRLTL